MDKATAKVAFFIQGIYSQQGALFNVIAIYRIKNTHGF